MHAIDRFFEATAQEVKSWPRTWRWLHGFVHWALVVIVLLMVGFGSAH